jgi:hypothetical protein
MIKLKRQISPRCFSPGLNQKLSGREVSRVTERLFSFGCLKEAALKSIGEGIPFGMDTFEFEINGNLHITHVPR